MQNTIEVEHVSKTYTSTKRKLRHKSFSEDKIEKNVCINITRKGLLNIKRKETKALNDVSLVVKQGNILGLLGPNGAGKTTLAKIVSTLVLPDSGTVRVNGYDVEKETTMARFSLGLVTGGERSLYWKLTPLQNLRFFGSLYGLSRSESEARANEYLKIFGLMEKKDELVQGLSTGQKMKVAFIRSLMHDPQLLILDEYNRGLDPNASRQLREYIKKVLQKEEKKTILVMTHSMNVAEDLCDNIILIDKGDIIAEGTSEMLIQSINKDRIIEVDSKHPFNQNLVSKLGNYGKTILENGDINRLKLHINKDTQT
ncbi:MAG: ABC transporter ATP-binding protein, partial [Candidatus Heimdallarchaeota archaeon]|nr:ABC transporter ATP-binding protein [Candidatus Heimdallarchaeota archaeon]